MFDYDAELRLHDAHLRAAADVRPGDRVLDIGCGTGGTTRAAARAAVDASALGVDVSPAMLDLARRLTDAEGPRNVDYEQGDAQVHRFPPRHFDVCLSRFGTMFFADPIEAFRNIAGALRPGARLAMLVWQGRDRNEWSTAVHQAITGGQAPPVPVFGPNPFSLADPTVTTTVLTDAGFADVGVTDVHEPVYYGADVDAAYDAVLELSTPRELLAALDEPAATDARERLRDLLAARRTDTGVYFDSRAWLVTARVPAAG